ERPAALVVGRDVDQRARVRQGALRCGLQPADELPEDAGLGARRLLALRDAPGVELVEAGKLEPLEEVAAKPAGGGLERVERRGGQAVTRQRVQLRDVDGDVAH